LIDVILPQIIRYDKEDVMQTVPNEFTAWVGLLISAIITIAGTGGVRWLLSALGVQNIKGNAARYLSWGVGVVVAVVGAYTGKLGAPPTCDLATELLACGYLWVNYVGAIVLAANFAYEQVWERLFPTPASE